MLATTLLLAALALSLTFLGSAPTGTVGAGALDVVIVSLSSLTIFLLPLIALLISHDAIVGEMERGTMLLLLSYPVGRWQVILGKFCRPPPDPGLRDPHSATARRRPRSRLPARPSTRQSWYGFASMIGSSILLGAAFIAVGYLVSSLVARTGAPRPASPLGIWLVFVLIYDMALLGLLVVDQGQIVSAPVLEALLLLNPTDAYRLFNLTGSEASARSPAWPGLPARQLPASARPSARAGSPGPLSPLGLAALFFAGGSYRPCDPRALRRRARPCRLQSGGQQARRAAAAVALTATPSAIFCGMNVLEHPGPRARSSWRAASSRSGSPRRAMPWPSL